MASAVRQRVPFRFSEGEEDLHILDEQEQEEVIEDFRKQNDDSNAVYFMGLQVVLVLSAILQLVYLFNSKKISPLAVLFPDSTSEPLPLANGLAILQILIHINLSLNILPPNHSYRRLLPSTTFPGALTVPLPLSHPVAIALPAIAPLLALALSRGRADVLWWAEAGVMTVVVALVKKWVADGEKDIMKLERLRYMARGA
ncbi:hypothetical protein L226DRAFT_611039 [Lentinus tigrinus ALCF2SS1-7]|uniref:Uncharacterized protein n=1 Tax=Lentinus tigrinus ALCF2SS1-6 TaxID=1328759 RepID=A0A5C2SF54_9APHY|nr:hypothetical protein L227DRAFT_651911 [Lentinus tigrinus ALCF2SS1-6]RPD77843.1 hypothetical protein L226DRAFT_611039 [Lentinus tigrinus ALCF2SS1-7]